MCGIGTIERQNLKAHLKDICPLQVEPCSFEFAGCSVQVTRKDKSEHLADNMASHVDLLAGVCAKYKTKLDAKEKEVDQLQSTIASFKDVMKSHETLILSLNQKISQLQVSQQGAGQPASDISVPVFPPVDHYFLEFGYYKQANKKWTSKPFYTHPGGYKICLNVVANGIGKGKNSHVSVFANVMKGNFDGDLVWPFQGEIVVSLHLEYEDDIIKALVFGPKSPAKATQRVTEGEMNEFGQGEAQFVHFSKIASLSTLHFIVHHVYWKPNKQ
jgi:TNF receptor-associated factor 4